MADDLIVLDNQGEREEKCVCAFSLIVEGILALLGG